MFQFPAITPFIVNFVTIVVLILIIPFYRNYKLIAFISLTGLFISFLSLINRVDKLPFWAENMILINGFSIYFIQLILFVAILINIISIAYFRKIEEEKEEYYLFLQVAVLGTITMIASLHLIVFFIGLELLSIPLYVMIGYVRNNPENIEASIKYLILAAASTSIFLFGIALVYLVTGTMNIFQVVYYLNSNQLSYICLLGIGMILTALGFKLALSPFHMWSPDVYKGTSSPVTAFLATVSKAGAFALIINLFTNINLQSGRTIIIALIIISALSMFTGNLLALRQSSLKRLLACSSIAHMGYLFIPVVIGGLSGIRSAVFYISAYFITTIGAFTVISILSSKGKEFDSIDDFKGLYSKNKFMAIVLSVMMFSFAGIPLTAGFMSKFNILIVGVFNTQWLLIWFLIINSAIGLYYYLKVVFVIFKPISDNQNNKSVVLPFGSTVVLTISLLFVIWIGIVPNGLLKIIYLFCK